MTSPANCIRNEARVAQLILRDAAGNDAIVIDVLGPGAGDQGIQVLQGIKNLYHVPREVLIESGAYEEGGQIGDYPRVLPRKAEMTIRSRARTQADLELVETLLWSTLSTRWHCYWRQFDSAGDWRETKVQLAKTPDHLGDNIIGQDCHADWKVELLSGDPFWYSETLEHEIIRGRDMTKVAGTTNTWTCDIPWANPADERCYPQWASRLMTTLERWTLPDADGVYSTYNAPTAALIGKPVRHTLPDMDAAVARFLVDTYPTRPLLRVQNRSQQWARMKAEDFAFWLEPSTPVERTVTVTLVGGTDDSGITAFLPQRWDRPMGGQVLPLPIRPQYPSASLYPGANLFPGGVDA
ncbi:hypothetical protein OG579_17135 [Williamsia herbipolensis]|uniref:Minor tail protein n=1 Tax=Williamsia herbipolensis TaxID=1603258 RepID=A0AAU4JZZ3_9NOCA|nr:hypothetical protein [Williamsia herbipolensis]